MQEVHFNVETGEKTKKHTTKHQTSAHEALVGNSCERDCKYILMLKQEKRQRKTDTDNQNPNVRKSLQKVGMREGMYTVETAIKKFAFDKKKSGLFQENCAGDR